MLWPSGGGPGPAAVSRYDKTPESYDVGLHLRASMIWLNDLTPTTG